MTTTNHENHHHHHQDPDPDPDPDTLSLPRILCLHGGGVNARVFRLQCRALINHLAPTFRLVFLDAPYPASPHQDIQAVYGSFGPFYSWLPWTEPEPESESEPHHHRDLILQTCLQGMHRDAGSGPWVGVLGFSQGAKIAISLLWAQQRRAALPLDSNAGPDADPANTAFRFGVLMAGSPPIVHLDARVPPTRHIARHATMQSHSFRDWPDGPYGEHVVEAPTLHVHGLRDEGLMRHRRLMGLYCRPGRVRLVEWEGGHRLPIRRGDVDMVVENVVEMAMETGVL
ncbi:hypothetical protein E4U55_002001 [Claviceps digitariae]|nr:hypothetical protein E4U55_002001 [Claviceps digitariae]